MNLGHEEIFAGQDDYSAFIDLLQERVENYKVRGSAYSLMFPCLASPNLTI